MKAAFLIRCSTKKQEHERQIKDLTRLAKKFGYKYDDSIVYGEHITGKDDATQKDRLSIQHLKEDAANGLFDVVLVSEVSRMSRDPMSGRVYIRQLINMEIPVYFRDIDTWTIDPNTGKKVRDAETIIGGAFDAAWKYLKSMKTQIASGRRDELDNNCMSIGQPFFGYKRLGGRDKTIRNSWIIDDDAAEVVKDVFAEYLKDGATLKSTALAITARYGEKFAKKFSIGTIEHILSFESYASGIKNVNLTDPDTEEIEVFPVEIPTIIDSELYEQATKKRKNNRNTRSPYPVQQTRCLSKLLKCPICEHSFTPRSRAGSGENKYRIINGKRAYSWYCMSRINNMRDCTSSMSINDEKAQTVIWGLIKNELISSANLSDEERQATIERINSRIANIDNDYANFQNQIDAMNRRIAKAYEAYMDAPESIKSIVKDKYFETTDKCQTEIIQCTNKLEDLQKQKDRCLEELNFYQKPINPIDIISEAEADETVMRKLFLELIERIYPYPVSPGALVFEVHSKNGIYNVLLDANQRGDKRISRYIKGSLAYWQQSKNRLSNYDEGRFFMVDESIISGEVTEGVKFTKLSFHRLEQLCSQHGWEINYDLW